MFKNRSSRRSRTSTRFDASPRVRSKCISAFKRARQCYKGKSTTLILVVSMALLVTCVGLIVWPSKGGLDRRLSGEAPTNQPTPAPTYKSPLLDHKPLKNYNMDTVLCCTSTYADG